MVEKYSDGYSKTADLARRRLRVQASSATSEGTFSKAGLITSKKRQRLMADHVDGIRSFGWHYKDNGSRESAKRPLCVPYMQGEKIGEENLMAAQ